MNSVFDASSVRPRRLVPETFSRRITMQPARFSVSNGRVWSYVLTQAYPIFVLATISGLAIMARCPRRSDVRFEWVRVASSVIAPKRSSIVSCRTTGHLRRGALGRDRTGSTPRIPARAPNSIRSPRARLATRFQAHAPAATPPPSPQITGIESNQSDPAKTVVQSLSSHTGDFEDVRNFGMCGGGRRGRRRFDGDAS